MYEKNFLTFYICMHYLMTDALFCSFETNNDMKIINSTLHCLDYSAIINSLSSVPLCTYEKYKTAIAK